MTSQRMQLNDADYSSYRKYLDIVIILKLEKKKPFDYMVKFL